MLGRRLPFATEVTVSSSLELSCLNEQLFSVSSGDKACIQSAAVFWEEHSGLDLVTSDCTFVSLDQLAD